MSYPGGMDYDLGVGFLNDGSQPSGPADGAQQGSSVQVNVPSLNVQVTHGIFVIFFLALLIYSGAAYVVFRRINQAI